MQQILKSKIILPDWRFKNPKKEEFDKLCASIKVNGQTKNITVRNLNNGMYEVVDGRSVFEAILASKKEIDYIWCYVYRDVSKLESMLLYLQQDFCFESDYIDISKAIKEINFKCSKLHISKFTKYSYNEIVELIRLADYDFAKFKVKDSDQQKNFF